MDKINVAVIFGGNSPEHEISKISAKTIINGLSQEKYIVIPVYISRTGQWYLYDGSINNILDIDIERVGTKAVISPDTGHGGLLRIVNEKVKIIPIDVIIPALHGSNGEDGTIQGLFELSEIPYVGCNVLSSSVAMDKYYTKVLTESFGINVCKYKLVRDYEFLENESKVAEEVAKELKLPVFIKPANAGSSIGISKASNKEEILAGINDALAIDKKVVIEEAVVGRELECAVMGMGEALIASNIGEIKLCDNFYDFNSKYNNNQTVTLLPTDIPEDKVSEIKELSIKIFKLLDCSGLARIDFFLENDTNKLYFNEINTFPGFTSISMYPVLMKDKGYELDKLLDGLIDLAILEKNYEL